MADFQCWHFRCFTTFRTRRTPVRLASGENLAGQIGDGFTATGGFDEDVNV